MASGVFYRPGMTLSWRDERRASLTGTLRMDEWIVFAVSLLTLDNMRP